MMRDRDDDKQHKVGAVKSVNSGTRMAKGTTTALGYKRNLGQFFSPPELVEKCMELVQHKNGRLLEPACGNGAFEPARHENSVFIEIDPGVVTSDEALVMDFFDYPTSEKFDTIIGNPPYVDNACFTVKHATEIKVQANLYLYFIEKCFHHLADRGEMILIVPREFIKQTSARSVNNLLCENGTITHYFDYGDRKLFREACPNVCIFRYEKDNFSRETETFDGKFYMQNNDGVISFVTEATNCTVGELFEVKVGAVSGADRCFTHPDGRKFVCSKTRATGELRSMIYQEPHPALLPYKETLKSRKIRRFDESNWYMWGRPVDFRSGAPRIYVNCKTRVKDPFFANDCDCWDGAVLALFPRVAMDLDRAVRVLNQLDWNGLGFMTGGRYLFSQKALKEAPIDRAAFG